MRCIYCEKNEVLTGLCRECRQYINENILRINRELTDLSESRIYTFDQRIKIQQLSIQREEYRSFLHRAPVRTVVDYNTEVGTFWKRLRKEGVEIDVE